MALDANVTAAAAAGPNDGSKAAASAAVVVGAKDGAGTRAGTKAVDDNAGATRTGSGAADDTGTCAVGVAESMGAMPARVAIAANVDGAAATGDAVEHVATGLSCLTPGGTPRVRSVIAVGVGACRGCSAAAMADGDIAAAELTAVVAAVAPGKVSVIVVSLAASAADFSLAAAAAAAAGVANPTNAGTLESCWCKVANVAPSAAPFSKHHCSHRRHVASCLSVDADPTTTSPRRARVSITLRRRQSARKPTRPEAFARTALKTISSFSRP